MANIYEIADRFRAELLRHERQAATEMVRAYGGVWQRIRRRLDDLGDQIAQAQALGEDVSTAWLFQFERLQTLQLQVGAEIGRFARHAESAIAAGQASAAELGQQHAEQLLAAALGEPPPGVTVTFAKLPAGAAQDLVGFLQDGSPLRALLDQLGPEASGAVRDSLIQGVALGQGPRVIARTIRQALGGNLARALTIARTEMLRSYRESSRRVYNANRGVMNGWIWHAAQGTRTCPACWAMHGTEHSLDERLDDHPNGRCAMVPLTKTWEELGLGGVPETRAEEAPGTELFARLPEGQQRAILGPAAYEAYRAGAIRLPDLVGRRESAVWGTMRYARSLRAVLGAEEARRWQLVARANRR